MAKFSFENRPQLSLLTDSEVKRIHKEALEILEHVGVFYNSREALDALAMAGCRVDQKNRIVRFPPSLIKRCIESAPERFNLYDREGKFYAELGGDRVLFNPCSTTVNVLAGDNRSVRNSTIEDMKLIVKATDCLSQIDLASTAVVCSEIPVEMGDTYIYYLIMKGTSKPFVGGAVDMDGVRRSHALIKALFGSDEAVREKPYCIFDVCPSPPLTWSEIGARNIMDCARLGLPVEVIPLPLPGSGSPVTLAGSILQHTAESLSGLVLTQVVREGCPFVYGGAPVLFDMRTATPSMSAMEAVMISCGYALMGRYYGLPTHTYAAQSDAKVVDYQAGYEAGMSALMAAQAGINMVSGAGGLDYVAEFSAEKLLMDAEVIGFIKRYLAGVKVTPQTLARELIASRGPGGDFLQTRHTREWFKREQYIPGPIVDRQERVTWEAGGQVSIFDRAKCQLDRIRSHPGHPLDPRRSKALDRAMLAIARDVGVSPDRIPMEP
jgi:trimethylamine--corrinoid protein Co-methyltransferase